MIVMSGGELFGESIQRLHAQTWIIQPVFDIDNKLVIDNSVATITMHLRLAKT